MKGKQFTIDDRSATSIDEIEATSAAMVAKGPVSMIGIDYASLIVGGSGERRSEQVASISRRLKAMAKRLNVPVVVLAQLKREETDRPNSSSFAETDQITRDADQLWLLSCEEAHLEHANRPISFRKSKCRGGSCISLDLFFKAPQMTFKVREIQDQIEKE
jgi:replicative DNA helicase